MHRVPNRIIYYMLGTVPFYKKLKAKEKVITMWFQIIK
mgnify:CR=1 FL=1